MIQWVSREGSELCTTPKITMIMMMKRRRKRMRMVVFVTMIVAIRVVVVMQKTTYIEINQNKVIKDP